MKKSIRLLSLCGLAASPLLAQAQNNINQQRPLEEIVVRSSPLHKQQAQMAQFTSVLEGDRLRQEAAANLGESLAAQLGVASASFGPGVGRPVIRGQGGDRVRVMQDGTGTLDLSTISPDHAVAAEAMLAERIEIIRGPNTLIYGSGAIGGVINVIDNRIPEQVREGVSGGFEQRHNTAAEENTTVFKVDAGSGAFALHLDAFYRDQGLVEIPGFAALDADADEPRGIIENSNGRAKGATLGGSVVDGENFIGLAVSRLENHYGIPPGAHEHGHEDEHEEDEEHEDEVAQAAEFARIQMTQNRYELKGRLADPFAGFERLAGKLTYSDYRHIEFEGGEAGTVFDNEATEARLELTHKPLGEVHGVIGLHWLQRDFAAVGAEAYVPPSDIESRGIFLIQDVHIGDWTYEWGGRFERQQIDVQDGRRQDQDALSLSASAVWNLPTDTSLSLVLARSQRVPAVEELFAEGLHIATNSYEIGNAALARETARNIELSWRQGLGLADFQLNLFYNDFQDYIYEAATGEFFDVHDEEIVAVCPPDEECIAVYRFTQADATFHGVEAELTWDVLELAGAPLQARVFGEHVRAELDRGGDIPRLPPLSYGLELRHEHTSWSAFVRATFADEQDKPGANENPTASYTRLDAGISYYLGAGELRHTLFLKGTNLLDEEIRNATSFLRELAPEPGRSFVLGYRLEF